ncbi:hypothetical protein H9X57_01600 [Flavobacterium piscinae]|uniref:RHS repeat protein n=1 Tax=Flavobacterium piscinae TaxID=2506424 RepID=A0A4Q1KQQ9_9FLAO|nr:hypothetical protein [Flavobacterium piscinae]MBC8882568.1 hypothetical protein [Flavobacterium piscinae]RXR31254.1 hypothetical protein EQG68_10230 [Flavobacterium piscinae]
MDRITTKDSSGNILNVIDYEYDINDLKIITETNSNGEIFTSTLNYNSEGKVTSITYSNGTEIFYSYGFFDDNLIGSEIKVNGTIIKHRYYYDQMQLISDKIYENDILICEINYTYDGFTINVSNNCTSENFIIEQDGTSISPLASAYDYQLLNINNLGSRNFKSILNVNTNQFTTYVYDEYNERNLVLNKRMYINGELINIIIYDYDLR